MSVYAAARRNGYDWLSLSHHVGRKGLVKPDGTPHRLVDRPSDPAYSWWTHPARSPIANPAGRIVIRPDPRGFPDHESGGVVVPPYSEALSLSSAARASTSDGEFVAFSGREFTTRSMWARGGEAGDGGHKVVLFPEDTETSCGRQRRPGAVACASASDLYRWVEGNGGIVIQAHPAPRSGVAGREPGWVRFHETRYPGGLSDIHVKGVEVGSYRRFMPTWERQYQELLRLGFHLFPAYGSDQHVFDFPAASCGSGAPTIAGGATVCWVESLSANGLADAMRDGRCYYSNAYRPLLQVELSREGAGPGELARMGESLSAQGKRPTLRVWARNDRRNQESRSRGVRFIRLEVVHVAEGGVDVIASCGEDGPQHCHCRGPGAALNDAGLDQCVFAGAVDVRKGAIYTRVVGRKIQHQCGDDGPSPCEGATTVIVGAPIYIH